MEKYKSQELIYLESRLAALHKKELREWKKFFNSLFKINLNKN